MKERTKGLAFFCVAMLSVSLLYAEAPADTAEDLMEKADLVISGGVDQVKATGQMQTVSLNYEAKVYSAVIEVYKVIKGTYDKETLVVDFRKWIIGLEADVQDAQFTAGDEGIAYLLKLPNGHFRALNGWNHRWNQEE